MTGPQRALLFVLFDRLNITSRDERLRVLSHILSRTVGSSKELDREDAKTVIDHLTAVDGWPRDERTAEIDILTRPAADPLAGIEPKVA